MKKFLSSSYILEIKSHCQWLHITYCCGIISQSEYIILRFSYNLRSSEPGCEKFAETKMGMINGITMTKYFRRSGRIPELSLIACTCSYHKYSVQSIHLHVVTYIHPGILTYVQNNPNILSEPRSSHSYICLYTFMHMHIKLYYSCSYIIIVFTLVFTTRTFLTNKI